jgi:VanZ family protein
MMFFIIYWLPPLIWMLFISPTNDALTVSSTSHIIVPLLKWLFPNADPVTIDSFHILVRKSIHFLEYALLAFLLFRAFRGKNKDWQMRWILYAGIITIGYSSLDEFFQTLIPSRTGELSDWMIDVAGAVFALCIITAMKKRSDEVKKLRFKK